MFPLPSLVFPDWKSLREGRSSRRRSHLRLVLSLERLEERVVLSSVVIQILNDFNKTGSLTDIVHLGDNPNDIHFIPPDPSGTTLTLTFSLPQDFPSLVPGSASISIDQYQADNSVPDQRSYVKLNGNMLGYFTQNSFITDLSGSTTLPVITDTFPVATDILTAGATFTLVVQAGISSSYDDFDVTNIRLHADGIEPDLAATSLTWDAAQSGVDFGYSVSGADLTQDPKAGLYWASGPTFDTVIGSSVYDTTIEHPVGDYGPFYVPNSVLGTPPSGANYLLEVVDPDNMVAESDETNNIQAIELRPDVVATSLTWDTAQGGVDFGYQVNGAAPPQDTTAALFWASGTTEATILEPAATPIPIPTTTPVGVSQEVHLDPTDLPGGEPEGAKYLLLDLNPNHVVTESDSSNDTNNLKTLRVHTPEEIFDGAVIPKVLGGVTLAASFIPGRDNPEGPFTLAEAAVVLGVDHFNWIQTIQVPNNLQLQIWRGVTQVDPISGKPLNGIFISTPSPAYDLVPNGITDDYYFRVNGPQLGDVKYYLVDDGGSDAYEPYLSESPPLWKTLDAPGGTASPSEFRFSDTPSLPSNFFLSTNSFITFQTWLVGISSSPGDWHQFSQTHTGFKWKYNTYHGPNGIAYLASRPAGAPPILGGGIFDVRYDDGSTVPGIPTDPPPIPSPIVLQSITVAGGKRRHSAAKNITINFSGPVTLGIGAFELLSRRGRKTRPIGLTVTDSLVGGITVAVLRFAGRRRALADGKYTLTVRADKILDSLDRPLDGDATGVAEGDLVKTLRIVRGRSK